MTFLDVENRFVAALQARYGSPEAMSLCDFAFSELGGPGRAVRKLKRDEEVPDVWISRLLEVLEALKTGRPIQYVFGEAPFFGRSFAVNEAVLIPRPETEELVDWIIRSSPTDHLALLDIGTGSGCIAVSLGAELPGAEVWATDLSENALAMAQKNAARHAPRVHFFTDDALSPEFATQPNLPEFFDVIVSNPPYITIPEQAEMTENVLGHEPHSALFVTNGDPLQFYRAIARFARKRLRSGGRIFLELNEQFAAATGELLEGEGFSSVELRQDINGKWRMASAMFFIS